MTAPQKKADNNAVQTYNENNSHYMLLFMLSRNSLITFVILMLAHLAALAFAISSAPQSSEPEPEPPKLQGLLIAPEPKVAKAPPKAEPTAQPQPEPVKPLPRKKQPELKLAASKAPTAIAATPSPKPVPNAPVKTTVAPVAAQPAPVVQLPTADATGLNNKAPVYPLLSRKRKEQGTVWLLILVSQQGLVTELKLKTSSGFARLDDAAMRAVKLWKFQPALKQGKPIDYWYELPVKFSLNQPAG